MRAVKTESQAQGEFLEWLESEKGFVIAETHEHNDACREGGFLNCGLDGHLVSIHMTVEKLLAEYHKIDLTKVENERRALLDHFRKEQGL